MPRIGHMLRKLPHDTREALRHRGRYATAADARRAWSLRLATRAFDGGVRDDPVVPLSLADYPLTLHLRKWSSDFAVTKEVFEKEIYAPVRRMALPPDARIIDLGGNIGLATLFFSQLCPQGRIVTVEPDAANMRRLKQNCAHLLDSGRLHAHEAFVAATDGQAGIARGGRQVEYRKSDDAPAGEERISCRSLPTLLSRHDIDTVDLLKCDVEGTERELFADCRDWIGRVRHITIEVHAPYRLEDLYRDLDNAGWQHEVLEQEQRRKVGTAFLKRRSK